MAAMCRILNLTVLFFGILFFSFPVIAKETENDSLQAAGCKTEYYLLQDLARGFKSRTNYDLETKGTGNMVGLKLLASGQTDFAFTCKHHSPLVKKFEIPPKGSEHWETVSIAKDPIVVLVHRSNPVVNLTKSQLRGIFSGAITNWEDVGGEDLPIKISRYNDDVGSGVLTVFKEIILGRKKDGSLPGLSASAKQLPGPANIGVYTSQNPGGIGFMGFNSYRRRYGSLLDIDDFAPSRENIVNGSYPLIAAYHIVYDKRKKDDKVLKAFFDYIRSDEGIEIANQSFISSISTP